MWDNADAGRIAPDSYIDRPATPTGASAISGWPGRRDAVIFVTISFGADT
jgi:hypothetical protein